MLVEHIFDDLNLFFRIINSRKNGKIVSQAAPFKTLCYQKSTSLLKHPYHIPHQKFEKL